MVVKVLNILRGFNWIDILMVCIVVRIIFIGLKRGFATESFKLFGCVFAIFVSIHYYYGIAQLLHKKVFLPERIAEVIVFVCLLFIVVFVFKLLREGALLLFKIEPHPAVERWGGLIVAALRSLVVCSIFLLLFSITRVEYLKTNSKKSITGKYLMDLSPKIYRYSFNNVFKKVFPKEKYNKRVFKLVK